ncbi:hypothetical protein ACEPAH_7527 [Sanghuangporus vaninii]
MSDVNANFSSSSTDRDNQPAGNSGNFGGGIGDRTQGSGNYGGGDVQDLSTGDQYGSSDGYLPEGVNNELRGQSADNMEEK